MTYGFVAIADNGNLLASSESANYEFIARYINGVRSGNITTYTIAPVDYPLVFIEIPIGGRAAILYCSGQTVRVIGDGNYAINVYRRVQSASGYGVAAFDSAASLTFKAGAEMLNVRGVGSLSVGGSFSGDGDACAFPACASRTVTSESVSYEYFTTYIWTTTESLFSCQYEYTCQQEYVCSYQTIYGFVNGYFTSWQEYVCGYQNVCDNRQVCAFRWYNIDHISFVYAKVKRTSWSVYRSVAKRVSANQYAQEWELHSSGFYKEVIGWQTDQIENSITPLPQGYLPPFIGIIPDSAFTGYSGYFTKDNTFPYSNGQTASISATIMTR